MRISFQGTVTRKLDGSYAIGCVGWDEAIAQLHKELVTAEGKVVTLGLHEGSESEKKMADWNRE